MEECSLIEMEILLQFLRDRDLDVEVLGNDVVTRLKREAEFFCLDEFQSKISNATTGVDQQPTLATEC
jgi:hypothetical protein